MSAGTRVLVVDDDPAILRMLRTNLVARGYDVDVADNGEDGVAFVETGPLDLVILDLMLPGMSGLDVAHTIRAQSQVPILVLSARGDERLKVRALDLGADDYLTKPFGMDELMARVRALLRRPPSSEVIGGVVTVGALSVDLDNRLARKGTAPLDLTSREFDVLAYMMRHAGKVVTHRLLLGEVWGHGYEKETQYLRVFVNRLRRKIEDDPTHPAIILTEVGVGYRLLEGTQRREGIE